MKLVIFGLVAMMGILTVPQASRAVGVPSVTSITHVKTLLKISDIGGRTAAFEVYVNYDEPMDQTINPVISYENPSLANVYPSGLQAGDCGGSWVTETQYLFPCALGGTDYPGEEVDDIDIRVAGAQDLIGTVQNDGLETNAFSIDTIAPVIAEVTPVVTPTNDSTPSYTFSSTEVGTIDWYTSCTSATVATVAGNNTVNFDVLVNGAYVDCAFTMHDTAGNVSNEVFVSSFTIDTSIVTVVASNSSNNDSDSNDHHGRRWILYRHYRSVYGNERDKKEYIEVRDLKNTNVAEFERLKAVYGKYKNLTKKERAELSLKISRDYNLYKNYRGHKLYKFYKNQIGR